MTDGARTNPRRWLLGSRGVLSLWDRVVVAGYLVLVLLGISTSSLGIVGLQDDPTRPTPGLIVGSPDAIRSDEFLRGTPWSVGILESGHDNFGSPLSYHDTSLVASKLGGPFSTLLFPESRVEAEVGHWAPTQMFAAGWWLAPLMLLLLLPRWFRRFGVDPTISLPITLVVAASPASIWWTWLPVTVLAWALLPAVAAATAVEQVRTRGRPGWWTPVLVLVVAVGLARLALVYQPWAIPLGAVVLVPMTVVLVWERRARLWAVGVVGIGAALGGILLLEYLGEHAGALAALSGTVYPGSRRFSGALSDPALLLAGPHLWVLETSPAVVATNLSESATGYTVLGAAALLLLASIRWRVLPRPNLIGCFVSAAVLTLLASWCLVAWPAPSSRLFPLSLVSPDRMAQVVGLAATLTFGLFLAAWRRAGNVRATATSLGVAVAVFFLSAVGGSAYRSEHLPSYRAVYVIGISLVAAAVVALAVAVCRWWALVPMVVAAVAVTATVFPWQHGFAGLRDGNAAATVRAVANQESPGDVWVTDDLYTDALLMANAIPSLSGQQWVGPDDNAWRVLDPVGNQEDLWNRGGAYIHFAWARPGSGATIQLPGADFIVVTVDPCGAELDRLHVAIIVSSAELAGSCLTERRSFDYGGGPRYVYQRAAS
jgi:hypothetical protein